MRCYSRSMAGTFLSTCPSRSKTQLRAMHARVQATVGNRETINRDYRGWETDMNVLAWHNQKEREGLRDISRAAVVDHVRDRFWAQDHSAVREAERATSMARTIERAYARTGRERPEPTVQVRSQERERKRGGTEREPDLDRVWERPLIGNRNSGYLPYARA